VKRYLLIIIVALNLRPAVTAVGPLLTEIRGDLQLSGTEAGALTTLPLVFFGSWGLLAPLLRRIPRSETLLVTSMALLIAGLLIRVIPLTLALFAGSLLAGIAISIGNIAVPSIIKRDHPEAITKVTAIYTVAVTVGAAAASGVVAPVERITGSGWRLPLALLAVPAALAGLVWLPRLWNGRVAVPAPDDTPGVWGSKLAWQVTGFMGLQSLLAYVVIGWLPTICQSRGMGEVPSGYVLALSSLMQAVGALAVPFVERRLRDQRPLVGSVVVLSLVGFAGIAWAPIGSVWVWTVVLGLGQGIGFATALSFIGLRASDAHVAARLSGMAQGVGYVIAAFGPLAIGALHDLTHGWTVPIIVILGIACTLLIPGLGAGRLATVPDRRP
jgi:cyanate transporter